MTKSYQAPDISQLTPYLTVKDADKSLEFYRKAFGFKLCGEGAMKDEAGKTTHVHMNFEDAHIMFGPEGVFDSLNKTPKSSNVLPGCGLYIYCPNVDVHYKQAIEAGSTSLMAPNDTFWGDRIYKVADPDGHEWTFATFMGE